MAYDGTFKKINVRSPYFITVAKAPSQVEQGDIDTETGEEPDTTPTEPVVKTVDLACGNPRLDPNIAETIKYNISLAGRLVGGTYSILFSDIRVPFKYKLGHAANTGVTFTEVGIDEFSDEWTAVGGTASNLTTTTGSYPYDAISETATYTSTQQDIDDYGETIQLEVRRPLSTALRFTLQCPELVSDTAPSTSGFVTMISLIVKQSTTSQTTSIKLNGKSLGAGSTKDQPNEANRYYFSDATLTTTSGNIKNDKFFNPRLSYANVGALILNTSVYKYSLTKKDLTFIDTSGVNTLEITNTQSTATTGDMPVKLQVARVPVSSSNFLGNADSYTIETIEADFRFIGGSNTATINFIGSNQTALSIPTRKSKIVRENFEEIDPRAVIQDIELITKSYTP